MQKAMERFCGSAEANLNGSARGVKINPWADENAL
jgi:hypothetical protein